MRTVHGTEADVLQKTQACLLPPVTPGSFSADECVAAPTEGLAVRKKSR